MFKSKKFKLTVIMALAIGALTIGASAAETVDVTATLTASFQQVIDDCLAMIGSVLPIAITVFGASVAIAFGIKWFKKIIGKA